MHIQTQEISMLLESQKGVLTLYHQSHREKRKKTKNKLPFCAKHEIHCISFQQNVFFHSLALLS